MKIDKQIESTEKRIAMYEKKRIMYGERLDKQLAALQKKGSTLTREDFKAVKTPDWKYSVETLVSERAKQELTFDKWCAISNNAERELENALRLANEHKELDALMKKRDEDKQAKENMDNVDNRLAEKLSQLLQPFREEWLDTMMAQHQKFFDRIHEKLPEAQKMHPIVCSKLDILYRKYGRQYRSEQIKTFEASRDAYARILAAPPARFHTQEEYMAYMKPELEKEFESHLHTLAARCRDFNLNVQNLKIHNPTMAERGFDVVMTDGKARLIDARIIFAAENSELVTPHLRFIVTERQTEQALEIHDNKKDTVNMDDKFNYMLLSRLQQDCLYYIEGGGSEDQLWAKSVLGQIEKMNELYDALPVKPEWLTRDELDKLIGQFLHEQHRRGRKQLLANPINDQPVQYDHPSQTVDDEGNVIHIADMQTMWQKLYDQFPDGLTIHLPDESLAHLLDVQEAIEQGQEHNLDQVVWTGQIENRNPHIVPEGTLDAAFRFPTAMYKKIEPNEEEYTIDTPETDEMDWEDRTATALLHAHGDNLKGAVVDVVIRDEILPYLYIEGQPFPKVVDLIRQTGYPTELELKQLLNLLNLHEKGMPADGRIHPCLHPLFAEIDNKYGSGALTPELQREKSREIMLEAELLLKNCKAIPSEFHNLVAVYDEADNNRAARAAVEAINHAYAPDRAFAVRRDNQVEVSIRSERPVDHQVIKSALSKDKGFIGMTEHPFKNIGLQHRAYIFCNNGQILTGYMGLEGIKSKNLYSFVPKEPGHNYAHIAASADHQKPEYLFATDDKVARFHPTFQGERMQIAHMVMQPELEKHQVLQQAALSIPDKRAGVTGQVWLSGRINGEILIPKQLTPADAQLYERHEAHFMDYSTQNLARYIFFESYYKDELNQAWDKELAARQKAGEQKVEHEQQLARITGARLYGKVDNIHVRCRIDGVQQMGRPLTKKDAASLFHLKDTAMTLGKDTLNYHNFVHPDSVTEMASNAFEDVLKQDIHQNKEQGMKR